MIALGLAAIVAVAPVQDHSGHMMPGMTMPTTPKAQPVRPAASAQPARPATPAQPAPKSGTDLPPGDAPAPHAPLPHAADRYFDAGEMARARDIMMREDGGGQIFSQVMVDIAELAIRERRDGYRWDGEAWIGGDLDRFVLKSEGEGAFRGALEAAEVQALYSRAIGPYFNLLAGVRQDIRPIPARTYAAVGVEGLAPYWFEVEATAFLSTRGEAFARVEGYYDQRITQRLILQPRAEINLSAQNVPAIRLGSGITTIEAGARLRYEIRRQFAPYVGVVFERKLGDTARFARRAGDEVGGAQLVLGLRSWF